MSNKNFYVTTPIYYVNDIPHIGHAYTSFAADTLARYKNLSGYNVFFLTGTDEHGQKVEESANKKKISPIEFTNEVSLKFKELTNTLSLTNNDFIRTSEKRHKEYVQKIWKKIMKNGDIYLGNYKGWYSIRDENFISENEIKNDENNNKLGPSGDILKWVEEPSYFFKLSKWRDRLLKFYKSNENFIMPKSRYNEVVKFVEGGLSDLSISRNSFDWGIKVPESPEHVIYVWLDALFNYISAISNEDSLKRFWPADFHIVGKDILRFHAVYWPAFLLSANLAVPKSIYAHGWWTIEGQKMSKSIGNVVDPNEIVYKYGSDQIRFFLLKEIPFGEDGNYSEELLVTRINSELANGLGNLFQRVLSMLNKYFDGILPELNNINSEDQNLLSLPQNTLKDIDKHMNSLQFNLAIDAIWKIIRTANAYVDTTEPWTLYKKNKKRLETVLYILTNTIYKIAILIQPFLPNCSKNMLAQLKQDKNLKFVDIDNNLDSGLKLDKPTILFPRIIRDEI